MAAWLLGAAAVLGNTLAAVVSASGAASSFVPVTDSLSQEVLGVTNQIRGPTGQRLKLESATGETVNQSLSLPELPGIRTPAADRDVVPANPLDLRNVAPRVLPRRGGVKLPVDLPGLPF